MKKIKFCITSALFLFIISPVFSQSKLIVPPLLTGNNFKLNIQEGSMKFYDTTSTPTYGINGVWMAPTIMVNKGEKVNIDVKNSLNVQTTIHWHGLHVPARFDGGPHQVIEPGETWKPWFNIMNNAGTFWYHPHGAGKTELQVAKGIAGFFIVKDSAEGALNLPRTYGVDDFPVCLQTRAFDKMKQIAIVSEMDTAIFVNGSLHTYADFPAQVVRLRLLNGSSSRTYNLGFSNGQTFYQIATDGGLMDSSLVLKKLLISPGERAEVLVNFSGMKGNAIQLVSYGTEILKGIHGADSIGDGIDSMPGYKSNPLNGKDFSVMKIYVTDTTAKPVKQVIKNLVNFVPYKITSTVGRRSVVMDTLRLLKNDRPSPVEGPFGINQKTFDMDSINVKISFGKTEVWTLKNRTMVAHPFHIHDVQFSIIERSGKVPMPNERGWKDVVLVMPNDSVKFITRFDDFTDDSIPYMYHCHILHHEDDGMMGSFIVSHTGHIGIEDIYVNKRINVFPNPATDIIYFSYKEKDTYTQRQILITDVEDREVLKTTAQNLDAGLDVSLLRSGMYLIKIISGESVYLAKVFKR